MSNADVLRLAVLAGDGVGPEITAATVEILQAAASCAALPLDLAELPIGYKSYNKWKITRTETIGKLRGHTGWILGPTFAGDPKGRPDPRDARRATCAGASASSRTCVRSRHGRN